MASINTKDHSTYIEVARGDPGSVIHKSVFSVAAYCEVLNQKGRWGFPVWQRGGDHVQEGAARVPGSWHHKGAHKVGHARVSMREWRKCEVLRLRWIWAPWDDGLVGPALKWRPELGEDAAAQRLNWHKLLPLLHVLFDKQWDFEQPCA